MVRTYEFELFVRDTMRVISKSAPGSSRTIWIVLGRSVEILLQNLPRFAPGDFLYTSSGPIEDIVQADRHCRKYRLENSSGNRPRRSKLV
ncbi:hypothetical protein KFK09_026040 [Dendrobium nobile]|uniref:Uncharacterized protein n=1 Tax=Dendrobium nobile TaxID=94219 RepID=A0A8T3A6C0_DENNO|nr:hypothetical protein KFK09_026040 [Dendrobium nobile]